jgi:uroporphyrinogen-III decarboxylase
MTDGQWASLCGAVSGTSTDPVAAFIIDSPWLPSWHGVSLLDYFASDEVWFEANRRAVETFPSAAFLPGFWAEFGMCTEPSAFGARCSFPENEFPFARPSIRRIEDIDDLEEPDPARDGLLPFVLKRMLWARPRMEAIGHKVRFSVSRGPLNIASFLMGVTELMVAFKTEPERIHRLLGTITAFLGKWHDLQRGLFPTIDGIMVLDDIVGFIGEEDFREFAFPYLSEIFSPPASIKLFHNDADCASSVKHYPDIGINLYNPGIQHSLSEIHGWSGGRLALLGAIPPRDVLASSSPAEIEEAVFAQVRDLPPGARVVRSCAGGMPPGVKTENIAAFLSAVKREGGEPR